MAAMQSKNDLLKDLGYVRELSTLMQTTEDADMLAEVPAFTNAACRSADQISYDVGCTGS